MDKSLAFILSLSVCIPLITGVIRYGQLPVSYSPLLYLLLAGLLSELSSYILFYNTTNAIPANVYLIVEFLILVWQFRRWKNILRSNIGYGLLVGGMTVFWIVENFVFGRIYEFSSFFLVISAIVLILLAVNQMNWLIVNERGNILLNPVFLICIALIIFFSYKVLTEIFYYYAPERMIKNNIFALQSYVNVGYNIILAIAILCIPPKKNFIQPSQ